jgi:hypothetical protein
VESITVCAKANSASREPFTGSTWVAASSATPYRRCTQSAMAWRSAGSPAVAG